MNNRYPSQTKEYRRKHYYVAQRKWHRIYDEKNRERIHQYNYLHYRKHKKERLEYAKIYRQKNLFLLLEKAKKRYWINPEKYRKQERIKRRNLWGKLKKDIFIKFGKMCNKCGFADIRALQIDHIKGDGSAHRKQKHPIPRLKEVLSDTENKFQLLCANCNWIKSIENKERKQRID